jgi:hypothetical protein
MLSRACGANNILWSGMMATLFPCENLFWVLNTKVPITRACLVIMHYYRLKLVSGFYFLQGGCPYFRKPKRVLFAYYIIRYYSYMTSTGFQVFKIYKSILVSTAWLQSVFFTGWHLQYGSTIPNRSCYRRQQRDWACNRWAEADSCIPPTWSIWQNLAEVL